MSTTKETLETIQTQIEEIQIQNTEIKNQLEETKGTIRADQEVILEEYLAQKQMLNRMDRNIADLWTYLKTLKEQTEK